MIVTPPPPLKPWEGVKRGRAVLQLLRFGRRDRLAELQALRWPDRAIDAALAARRRWLNVQPTLTPYTPPGGP